MGTFGGNGDDQPILCDVRWLWPGMRCWRRPRGLTLPRLPGWLGVAAPWRRSMHRM